MKPKPDQINQKPDNNHKLLIHKKTSTGAQKSSVKETYNSLYNYDSTGILKGTGYGETARGRARPKQLATMTDEQKEAEINARMERNRRSAKKCRLKKQKYIDTLETLTKELKEKQDLQDEYILSLEKRNKEQEKHINDLQSYCKLLLDKVTQKGNSNEDEE